MFCFNLNVLKFELQFEGKEKEANPESVTKYGWEVKIQSMREDDFFNMYLGSLINLCTPKWYVMVSTLLTSKLFYLRDTNSLILRLGLRWLPAKKDNFVQVRLWLIQSYQKKSQIGFDSDSVICTKQQTYSALLPIITTKYIHSYK